MKPAIALLGASVTAAAAESSVGSIEFAGYVSAGPERLFVLVDPISRKTSSWVKLEESWHGYRLLSFDAQRETLAVAKGEEKFELRLRSARVVDGRALPQILRGSGSASGDTIVYSADAELKFGSWIVRAVDSSMTYNISEGTLRGDFLVDDSVLSALMVVKGGVLKLNDEGGPVMTALSLSVQKKPNKAPEPTPGSVTPRATHESPK
jgi:hypothetical protein